MPEFVMTSMPLVWFVIALGLAVFEAMTITLVAIWFAIGALVAIIPAFLMWPMYVQIVVFLIASGVSLVLTRPIIKNKFLPRRVRTNADQNVGKIGVVIVGIDPINGTGRVKVDGLDWAARSEDGTNVEPGEKVLIKAISGVTLVVERIV